MMQKLFIRIHLTVSKDEGRNCSENSDLFNVFGKGNEQKKETVSATGRSLMKGITGLR